MKKLQNSLRNGTIVCDEGSMLGHKDALRFFGLADKLNLNVTIVGDPLQHGSVPRGALLKILKDYAGIREFRLHQIMRQKHAGYLAAAEHVFSEGKTPSRGFPTRSTCAGLESQAGRSGTIANAISGSRPSNVQAMDESRHRCPSISGVLCRFADAPRSGGGRSRRR